MKIVHIDFTGPYTDGATYQENLLPIMNAADGHDVTMLVENTFWDGSIRRVITDPSKMRYTSEQGVKIIRLPYKRLINSFVTDKYRYPIGLREELDRIQPNVIYLHCLQSMASGIVLKYLSDHPETHFVADSHSDYHNSARNFFSQKILHGIFYKKIAKDVEKRAETIFCVSPECKEFLVQRYHLSEEKLEYMPLGGIIESSSELAARRNRFRTENNISEKEIVLLHSGKIDALKKTIEMMQTFCGFHSNNMSLYIAGSVSEDLKKTFDEMLSLDSRIHFLGWINGDELKTAICGADVYLQPGSCSATAQTAICCGRPTVLANLPIYRTLNKGNCWLINDISELSSVFKEINENSDLLVEKSGIAMHVAKEQLDYKEQARRYLMFDY